MATDPAATRLATAPFEVVGRFADASNATLLARLLDKDDTPLPPDVTLDDLDPHDLAVYKPRRGETPLWDFPDGTLHRREVAAHVVSEALGWGLVPATVLRDDGPFGTGALQRYVAHDPARHYFHLRDTGHAAVLAQLRRMVVFDLVVDNADRKAGHVLLERTSASRLQCIDHGVCFHVERKLRTVAWDFSLEPLPTDVRADVERLVGWLDADGRDALAPLLAEPERAALRQRAVEVASLDVLPEPFGPRPFPWPLV